MSQRQRHLLTARVVESGRCQTAESGTMYISAVSGKMRQWKESSSCDPLYLSVWMCRPAGSVENRRGVWGAAREAFCGLASFLPLLVIVYILQAHRPQLWRERCLCLLLHIGKYVWNVCSAVSLLHLQSDLLGLPRLTSPWPRSQKGYWVLFRSKAIFEFFLLAFYWFCLYGRDERFRLVWTSKVVLISRFAFHVSCCV